MPENEPKAPVLDLVDAWARRGRQVPIPRPEGEPLFSTLGARMRIEGRQLVMEILERIDGEHERIGNVVFTPARAREWGHYLLGFAASIAREDLAKERVALGLCATPNCTRKLVAGTERCRRCGEEIAASLARAAARRAEQEPTP